MMKSEAFVAKLKKIAEEYKTIYVVSGFGAPGIPKNKTRYLKKSENEPYAKKINAADKNTFFFDCVGLVKGVLWGWDGKSDSVYGGATYSSNGLSDINLYTMINKCTSVSTDFKAITPGELLFMKGHVGVYIGDGKVVESTPAWKGGVQITKITQEKWEKHGFLPWVDYKKDIPKPVSKTILFNGQKKVVKSIVVGGENHVRLRDFCSLMNYTVDWTKASGVSVLTPGEGDLTITVKYNVHSVVYNEENYVRLRDFDVVMGMCTVSYNEKTNTVEVNA